MCFGLGLMEINYTVLVFSIKLLALLNGILFMNCIIIQNCVLYFISICSFRSFIYIQHLSSFASIFIVTNTDFSFFSYRYTHILHLQTRMSKTKANTVFIRLFSTNEPYLLLLFSSSTIEFLWP